ncbi:MAG TPA: Uma2 family endonuclease [Myxococcaceae bacterium]|nr:Uma2 family endonuclease [Myxococcaceae bacterium]
MLEPSRRPATYDDLRALPHNLVGELIDGELWSSPRPAFGHAHATSTLGIEVGGPFGKGPFGKGRGGPGGWWILDEPEVHLGDNVLVPDLAGWRRERLPHPTADLPFLSVPPDWVCEVLSPSTSRLDRIFKTRIYARAGIPHLWFVDPLARTLEAFRLHEGQWLQVGAYENDEKARIEPFDAIELQLGVLWLPENPSVDP